MSSLTFDQKPKTKPSPEGIETRGNRRFIDQIPQSIGQPRIPRARRLNADHGWFRPNTRRIEFPNLNVYPRLNPKSISFRYLGRLLFGKNRRVHLNLFELCALLPCRGIGCLVSRSPSVRAVKRLKDFAHRSASLRHCSPGMPVADVGGLGFRSFLNGGSSLLFRPQEIHFKTWPFNGRITGDVFANGKRILRGIQIPDAWRKGWQLSLQATRNRSSVRFVARDRSKADTVLDFVRRPPGLALDSAISTGLQFSTGVVRRLRADAQSRETNFWCRVIGAPRKSLPTQL